MNLQVRPPNPWANPNNYIQSPQYEGLKFRSSSVGYRKCNKKGVDRIQKHGCLSCRAFRVWPNPKHPKPYTLNPKPQTPLSPKTPFPELRKGQEDTAQCAATAASNVGASVRQGLGFRV